MLSCRHHQCISFEAHIILRSTSHTHDTAPATHSEKAHNWWGWGGIKKIKAGGGGGAGTTGEAPAPRLRYSGATPTSWLTACCRVMPGGAAVSSCSERTTGPSSSS